jgi:predicted enzyme related to lactoylglutathione lyase
VTRFCHFTLRTTDISAARAFYASVLGDGALEMVPLPEPAIARGARPHWLGYLDVADVDRAVAAFCERGATPLGPKWLNAEGREAAVLRDPGGAVVALAQPPAATGAPDQAGAPGGAEVVWYELNTVDVARAQSIYGELFGWEIHPPVDRGRLGIMYPFAWARGGALVGAMRDIAAHPGVHPHWLFHFRVAALAPALSAVRDAGGVVAGTVTLPEHEPIAVCDDSQGAAFALRERGPGVT